MIPTLILNLKSMLLYHKRYALSQLATYLALAFILLTAARLTLAYSEAAGVDETHVYRLEILSDISEADLNEALTRFLLEEGENCAVQLYSPVDDNAQSMLVGLNDFIDVFWTWNHLDEQLIQTAGLYAWMASGFWTDESTFRFPYRTVNINGSTFEVAGVCDVLMQRRDDRVQEFSERAVYIPAETYLQKGYPIESVCLRLYRRPDADMHRTIDGYFSFFTAHSIDPLPRPGLGGFGSLVGGVCLTMIAVCALLMSIQIRCACEARGDIIRTERACGATVNQLIFENWLPHFLTAVLGGCLAIWPSNAIYWYLKYIIPFPPMGWAFVAVFYLLLTASMQFAGTTSGVRRALSGN